MLRIPGQQRGFTLGELLTVVSVIGVSLAIAVPSFQSITRNNRRATAVNQLVTAMHMSRSEAVTRNQQVTLCPSTDGESCGGEWNQGWIFFPDANQNRARDDDEVVLGAGGGLDGLSVKTEEFPDFMVYRPNGRVMGATVDENTGRFTFCDARGPEYAGVVMVNASGQPVVPHDTAGLGLACPVPEEI